MLNNRCFLLRLLFVVTVLVLLQSDVFVLGLFEDQAGTYDWRQQHVGLPLFSRVDLARNKLYVATEHNLLGAINIKSGGVAWRKIYEANSQLGKVDKMIWGSKEAVVVTGGNGMRVQAFDYNLGFSNWEYVLFNNRTDQARVEINGIESIHNSDMFYFTNGYQLCFAGIKDKYCADLPSDGGYIYSQIFEHEQGLFVIGIKENSIQKLQYNSLLSNLVLKSVPLDNGNLKWLTKATKCESAGDSNRLNCYSPSTNKIYSALISTGNQLQFTEIGLPDELANTQESRLAWSSDETFLIQSVDTSAAESDYEKSTLYLIKADSGNLIKKIDNVVSFHISSSKEGDNYLSAVKYVTLNKLNVYLFNLKSGQEKTDSLVSLTTSQKVYRSILHMSTSFGTTKSSGQLSLNTMLFFEDYSMTLFNSQGVRYFTREESLAYITNVEFIDFPLIHLQEEFEDEFGHSENDNLVTMLYKRIRSQLNHLREFLFHDLYFNVISLINNNLGAPQSIGGSAGPSSSSSAASSSSLSSVNVISIEDITRDEFNLNKLIVVTTSVGKVLGLYTNNNGPILWSFYLKFVQPFSQLRKNQYSMPLFIQRTSAHFPHEPQCVLVAKYKSSKTLVYYFNPLTGKPSKDHPKDGLVLDYQLKQVFLSSVLNEHFLKPLVLFDQENKLHILPQASANDVIEKPKKPLIIYTTNTEDERSNSLVGYTMKYTEKPLIELWRVNLEDEQIIAIGAKQLNDRTHSQGKVLGDRSVLYKYLNPNLIGVMTTGQDGQKVPFVNLYLIDTVTGSIVNSFNHKRCRGPVNIVHSENWFFYSYYNIKYRRSEVTSLELFEGSTQFNSTHFSSLDDVKLIFYTKTYIIQKSFEALQVTLTEKGISTKDIIAAGQFGIVYEIPWFFVDSRRPLKMTDVEREENLIPYMPEIPLNYEFSLNYYNYIYNIRGISTAASGLESTSLVFVYGLDIYFTRVFPSKTFDMLREDFDFFFISTLMVGLVLGTILSKKLASSSNLNKAWK